MQEMRDAVKAEIVKLEIAFAQGWNSATRLPLPPKEHWGHHIKLFTPESEVYKAAIEEANKWELDHNVSKAN